MAEEEEKPQEQSEKDCPFWRMKCSRVNHRCRFYIPMTKTEMTALGVARQITENFCIIEAMMQTISGLAMRAVMLGAQQAQAQGKTLQFPKISR